MVGLRRGNFEVEDAIELVRGGLRTFWLGDTIGQRGPCLGCLGGFSRHG